MWGEPQVLRWFLQKRPYCIHLTALVALFCLRAFLLHLPKHFRHVLDLIPNIKTYIDRCALLSRHRDTIAGSCVYFDDLLQLRFVLRAEDKSRKIGAALEIVDDHPFDLCSERSHDDP